MKDTITVTIIDEDTEEETSHELPAKMEVCSRCQGYGGHLTHSIGQHAYSQEEFNDAFDDDEDRAAYFERGGKYDVQCEECHGLRVCHVIDWELCEKKPKLKEIADAWDKQEQRRADGEAEDEACYRMERMMGC